MPRNETPVAGGMHGTRRNRFRTPVLTERTRVAYESIADEVKARMPKHWRDDMSRSKSPSSASSPLLRTLEQIREVALAGDPQFALTVGMLARQVAESACAPLSDSLNERAHGSVLRAAGSDAAEDVAEFECMRTGYRDKKAVLALAKAKARSSSDEAAAAADLYRLAESMPDEVTQ